MAEVYQPYRGVLCSSQPLDPTKCKAGVTDNDRTAYYHQCRKKAGRDGWCAAHHPDAVAARRQASSDRFDAQTRKLALGWYGERFLAALCKIRDGDNDPRATAREALDGVKYLPLDEVQRPAK